jgi:citronellol/citronellal dehydrogenase
LSEKVAFITGGSRGIGKAVAHKLAAEGWSIVIAAKTVEPHPKLEGTIYTAQAEVEKHGGKVLALQCDVTDDESIGAAAEATLSEFGRIDAVINNAGALWWKNMEDTPPKRFDIMMNVNARGAYNVTLAFLRQMKEQKSGHVICMSPPISRSLIPGRIAYSISKFGMTFIAYGIAEEYEDYNIKGTALWPATLVESQATINHQIGDESQWRKADVMADATFAALQHPELSNGKALYDEDILRAAGCEDFDQYDCVPGSSPTSIRMDNALG